MSSESSQDPQGGTGSQQQQGQQNGIDGNSQENATGSSAGPACGFTAACMCVDWKGGFEYAKQVVTDPMGLWKKVKAENWTVQDIYYKFLIPFSAIPPVAQFIGFHIFGPLKFFPGLVGAVVHYAGNLVFAYVVALGMKELSTKFGGSATLENVLKLFVFTALPFYFASVLFIVPFALLAFIPLLAGLAGIYAFYQGIPEMTGVPEKKRVLFLCAVVLAAIVYGLIMQKLL